MNSFVTRLIWQAALGTASVAVVVALGKGPASAQSTAGDLVTPSQNEGRDLFSDRNDNPMSGIHDLIHQLNYGSIRSPEEFRRQQQQNINSAAEQFRARQRAILEQQQQQAQPDALPPAPAAAETPVP
ncbi:hypothetical protein [Thermoleptolyngbya sp. M55_K2018_002]|uniref:hypothetical protein n=1 Tax=Thermoleptolyngbya sp. M55_K2018_002 TaxID=2747808 RepID=UPI0019DA1BF1|nr:hypothetical protein [Thermoleptolyngbya sp. M55_K2018_002]HIK41788.1 hypothetical protein [Thermoleptolyngbya sp. M55_K2018_002]